MLIAFNINVSDVKRTVWLLSNCQQSQNIWSYLAVKMRRQRGWHGWTWDNSCLTLSSCLVLDEIRRVFTLGQVVTFKRQTKKNVTLQWITHPSGCQRSGCKSGTGTGLIVGVAVYHSNLGTESHFKVSIWEIEKLTTKRSFSTQLAIPFWNRLDSWVKPLMERNSTTDEHRLQVQMKLKHTR